MDKNNRPENPRAFPNPVLSDIKNCNADLLNDGSQYGMTIRDFAQIHFMSAILSSKEHFSELINASKLQGIKTDDLLAKVAGGAADAFLKERQQYEQRED